MTDSLSDTLSVVNLDTGELMMSSPLGRNPVDIDGPHHVVVDALNGVAYVGLSYPIPGGAGPHAGHGSSQALGWVQRVSLADLRIEASVRIKRNPGDLLVSADGKRIVVSHFDLAAVAAEEDERPRQADLAIIDAAAWRGGAMEPPVDYVTVCGAPHGMALSPDGRTVYVACYGEDVVGVVDLESKNVELVPVGSGGGLGIVTYGPYSATLSPDGTLLAVSNLASKDIRFFEVDGTSLEPLGDPVRVPGPAYFPAWEEDGSALWLPYQAPPGLARIESPRTGTRVDPTPLDDAFGCEAPHEVELHGTELLLVCEGDHVGPGSLVRLERSTLELVTSTPVGVFPDAIAVLAGSP